MQWAKKKAVYLGLREAEEKSLYEEMQEEMGGMCPSLSYRQRLWGFGICVCIGSVLDTFGVMSLYTMHIIRFAVLYTIGNIVSLCATSFLVGPCQQIKNMINPVRAAATFIFFACMAGTLYCALGMEKPNVLLVIVLCICQTCALLWYCCSYIPFGRRILSSCVGSAVSVI